MNTLFRARILNPLSARRVEDIRDGALAVGADGRILAVGPYAPLRARYRGAVLRDYHGRVLIPGLVDAHIHLPQLDQRGRPGANLLEWLQQYIFAAEMEFSQLHVVESVGRRFFKKLILNGTTTAAVHTTIHAQSTHLAFALAVASGLRIIMGKVMMDQHAPRGLRETTSQALRDSEWLCAEWDGRCGGRIRYAFTPRFAPTCSEPLWRETGKLVAQSGAYLQTHLAETPEENARVRELFPPCRDYVQLFERTQCLQPRSLFAHAIHLSRGEYRRLARAGCGLAHCPTSNFFLKSGRMPLDMVLAEKLRVGLGTDVGAGPSMSMFTVMRHADYMQPAWSVDPRLALYLATMGGARALALESEIGNFAPGKWADCAVLDIHGIDPEYHLDVLDTNELLALLMYRGDSRVVTATYLAGQRLDMDGF